MLHLKLLSVFKVLLLISFFNILIDCIPLDKAQENSTNSIEDVLTYCDRPICKNWELVTNVTIEDTLPVYKFRSKRTGMIIVLAEAESPIVNGYFCLSTEAFNDDGLPHTLEHLVFLGRLVKSNLLYKYEQSIIFLTVDSDTRLNSKVYFYFLVRIILTKKYSI